MTFRHQHWDRAYLLKICPLRALKAPKRMPNSGVREQIIRFLIGEGAQNLLASHLPTSLNQLTFACGVSCMPPPFMLSTDRLASKNGTFYRAPPPRSCGGAAGFVLRR